MALGSEALSCQEQGHGWLCSHPLPHCTEGSAESSEDPVSALDSQEEGPSLDLVAGLLQVSSQLLYIPAALLVVGHKVINDVWVEGCGDTFHQQLGIHQQGKQLLVTIGVIYLQETRKW